MRTTQLKIDLAGAAGVRFTDATLALAVHFPDAASLPARPVLIFAVPGGGYGRGYYDMRFDGHRGYSQAEHHAARGLITVAVDHLGVGESSTANTGDIQFEDLAAVYDACVREVLARLGRGEIDGVAAIRPRAVIGIGQSMGGCVTILTQARHRSFDAIAILGYSAIHTRLPHRDPAASLAHEQLFEGVERGGTGRSPRDAMVEDYAYPFHFEDVPADIVAADLAGGFPYRRTVPPFGSATLPDCAVQMMTPGVVSQEAAAIAVPVFVGNGERDVCGDPRAEPGAYSSSPDITTVIVPRMAHMHNFASSRVELWDRLAGWYETVQAEKKT